MNEIRQVAIYCRVSTEEQATEGYSISAQLQTLRQYAQLYGWEIAGEYADEGISGKNITGRPAIQKLIADVENNKFQAVLVWKISRLSRNMLDTLTLLDLFEANDVKFISYSENFDTGTPIGRLVVQLMASIAEMERNTLSENVKLGMKQRAYEGYWNGGIVFGYNVVDKALVINEKEAFIVKLAFELYAEGKGLKAVANHLNKAGYRTKRGHHFSVNGVAQILDNIVYNGKISWAKVENWDSKRRKGKNPNPIIVEGKHEAIIPDDLWNIVQARRNSRSFKQRQSNEPFYLVVFYAVLLVIKVWCQQLLHGNQKTVLKRNTVITSALTFTTKDHLPVVRIQLKHMKQKRNSLSELNNLPIANNSFSQNYKLLTRHLLNCSILYLPSLRT